MGMFSWICSDTNKALTCYDIDMSYSRLNKEKCTKKAFLLVPSEFGTHPYYIDNDYDGYGKFYDLDGSEIDVYEEYAKWNCPDLLTGELEHDRRVGIDFYYNHKEKGLVENFPIKIVEYNIPYELANPSKDDPNQGWGYDENYNEEAV